MAYIIFQTLIFFPAARRESIAGVAAWCVADVGDIDELVGLRAKAVGRHLNGHLILDRSGMESTQEST